jgi:hypothetical protein
MIHLSLLARAVVTGLFARVTANVRLTTRVIINLRLIACAVVNVGLIACAIGGPLRSVAYAQAADVDQATSQALTSYLKQNRLPLVGAQVIKDSSGGRRLVLYGFVATDEGKVDAEQKAIGYLGTPVPAVDDRLVIKPELATMTTPPQGDRGVSQQSVPPQSGPDDQSMQGGAAPARRMSFDSLYQQIQQYGIKSPPGE